MSILQQPTTIVPSRGLSLRFRLFRTAVLVLVVLVVFLGMLVTGRDMSYSAKKTPDTPPPTLEQLNGSIKLAERYLDGLYKPLPNGEAVQSEAYGLPLKAYFLDENEWVFLGEGAAGECAGSCKTATTIDPGPGSDTSESYTITFTSQTSGKKLVVRTIVNWAAAPGKFSVTVQPQQVTGWVELSLDTVRLATFHGNSTKQRTKLFALRELPKLRMLRYTVRHGVQEAYMYWKQRGDEQKADRLATFMRNNGYTPGFDMRAPMFGQGQNLPDDLPFDQSSYPDCGHTPAAAYDAYAYQSKACLALSSYLDVGKRDAFLQASLALHVLQKYADPRHEYAASAFERWWMQGSHPDETARHLRRQWSHTGFGIPACTPLSCSDKASGIRTFAFGALETELGYRYGQPAAQHYADAAAAVTVTAQIKANGLVRMPSRTLYRPAQVGAFPAAWGKADGQFAPPTNGMFIGGIAAVAVGTASMPPEYLGVQVSNSETTFDGLEFLLRYRCYKYAVGCASLMN